MEPRAAWGAGVVLLAVTAAGSLPGKGAGPATPPCADRELAELRAEPGDEGAFDPPRLVCGHGLGAARVPPTATTALLLGRPVDVNLATTEDLEQLPGIGAGLARRIVEARERDGPFVRLEELRRVKGLGASRIRALEGWAVTGSGGAR